MSDAVITDEDDDILLQGPPCAGNWNTHPLGPEIITALKTVYDPEIPVNVHDLGLIYRVDILDDLVVEIDMTLTAPGCPVAEEMPGMVGGALDGMRDKLKDVGVAIVWDPPWTMDRMSEVARIELGMF